ncbi:MAG TPA: EamA family transporter [Trebonia sp.]|nr:EamA family transporter [Trebonia sp.]
MPASVTLAVLGAAITHAIWNALAHRIKDQVVSFALIGIGSIVVAIPLIVVAAMPRGGAWPFLAASAAIHVFYMLFLMRSFTLGDFGQVYPVARGTSPLVVTVLAAAFLAEWPTAAQLAGVLVISAGMAVLVLAGRRGDGGGGGGRGGTPSRAALLAAFATGLTIAAYTVVDGTGVRRSGSPVGYIAWLMLLTGLGVPAWAAVRRRRELRAAPRAILASGLAAGALSVLAYGLVLWAQTRGALAPIAALRETSVIFGALIATLAFREPFGRARIAAAVVVAAGIVILSL